MFLRSTYIYILHNLLSKGSKILVNSNNEIKTFKYTCCNIFGNNIITYNCLVLYTERKRRSNTSFAVCELPNHQHTPSKKSSDI